MIPVWISSAWRISPLNTTNPNSAALLTPHGPDFSFIDTAKLVEGQTNTAIATKFLDPKLPFFAHHFPDQPLMPGVLMIEAAAQAAGWLWAHSSGTGENSGTVAGTGEHAAILRPLHLASVQGFRFLAPAVPGDTLRIEVTLDKELGTLAQFSARLSVSDRAVAEGRISLSRPSASPLP